MDTGGAQSLVLREVEAASVLFLRVTAVNDGGESLPSKTLTVGVGAGDAQPVLLVGGFDRLDPELNVPVSYPTLESVGRLFLRQMNSGAHLVPHGAALAASGTPFDSCVAETVDAGAIDPESYRLVIWQTGRGATPERGLTALSRAALSRASAAGRALVVSGSTVARSLAAGSPEDQEFLETALATRFVTATESLREVNATDDGFLAGLAPWSLSGPAELPYDTGIPDVLAVAGSAQIAADYATGAGAVVQSYAAERCAVLLGFPLETVRPPERIVEIIARAIEHCGASSPPVGGDSGPPEDGGCSCGINAAPPTLALLLAGALLLCALGRRRA